MSLRTRYIYIFTVELNSNLSHINDKSVNYDLSFSGAQWIFR